MPHILPCPAPRVAFADAEISKDGRRRIIRRTGGEGEFEETAEEDVHEIADAHEMLAKKAHGCPVPKPSGVMGEVLGFAEVSRERKYAYPRSRVEVEDTER